MTRAFVALPIPEPLIGRLVTLSQMLPLKRRVPPENYHVTLAFLGDVTDMQLDDLHDALLPIRSAPFGLTLTPPALFGGEKPRVIHAGVDPAPPLVDLHDKVQGAMRKAGLAPEGRRFVPHVTLSRESPRGPDLMRLETALADLSDFSAGPETVRDFRVMESHLGSAGPDYEPLELYPLNG
ncbi:RNA 2',3'-cyclic phosphodiesterase [Tranquillimonas rosea]|uniref:RNA 2',3'-cyclic phosphodiesterase n=1 Tax=Tranquillimonas rosea TaxID=641238 RepID=UPI003BA84CED